LCLSLVSIILVHITCCHSVDYYLEDLESKSITKKYHYHLFDDKKMILHLSYIVSRASLATIRYLRCLFYKTLDVEWWVFKWIKNFIMLVPCGLVFLKKNYSKDTIRAIKCCRITLVQAMEKVNVMAYGWWLKGNYGKNNQKVKFDPSLKCLW
jgi:hypothetical protein